MKRTKAASIDAKGCTETPSPLLTIEETAILFRTTAKTIRKAVRAGELETFRLGRTIYILREPLEQRIKAAIPIGLDIAATRSAPPAAGNDTEEGPHVA